MEYKLTPQEQAAWDDVYHSANKYNKIASVKNGRIFREVMWRKGRKFLKEIYQLFEECEVKGAMMFDYVLEVVDCPVGEECETGFADGYYRKIKTYWVDQYSVGMEGDSWSGHIYVKIGNNRYIKAPFSM